VYSLHSPDAKCEEDATFIAYFSDYIYLLLPDDGPIKQPNMLQQSK
jgi:hypothetical protein